MTKVLAKLMPKLLQHLKKDTLCRPFVEAHGVDHDDNVDGFSVERVYTLRKPSQYLGGAPSTVIVQLHKDKSQFSLQSEADSSYWHK